MPPLRRLVARRGNKRRWRNANENNIINLLGDDDKEVHVQRRSVTIIKLSSMAGISAVVRVTCIRISDPYFTVLSDPVSGQS